MKNSIENIFKESKKITRNTLNIGLIAAAVAMPFMDASCVTKQQLREERKERARNMINKGFYLWEEENKSKEALDLYLDALKISPSDTLNIEIYAGLGNCYYDLGKLDLARQFMQKAVELDERYSNISPLIMHYYKLGKIYRDKENIDQAQIIYQKALDLQGEKVINAHYTRKIYDELWKINEQIGRTEEANKWHERYSELDNEIKMSGTKGDFKKY